MMSLPDYSGDLFEVESDLRGIALAPLSPPDDLFTELLDFPFALDGKVTELDDVFSEDPSRRVSALHAGSADTCPTGNDRHNDSQEPGRSEKVRERNRQAQARFRQKKRAQQQACEQRIAELSPQVAALQEHARGLRQRKHSLSERIHTAAETSARVREQRRPSVAGGAQLQAALMIDAAPSPPQARMIAQGAPIIVHNAAACDAAHARPLVSAASRPGRRTLFTHPPPEQRHPSTFPCHASMSFASLTSFVPPAGTVVLSLDPARCKAMANSTNLNVNSKLSETSSRAAALLSNYSSHVREYKVATAASLARPPEHVCWFLETPLAAAPGKYLSMSSHLGSVECAVSFLLSFLLTLLENSFLEQEKAYLDEVQMQMQMQMQCESLHHGSASSRSASETPQNAGPTAALPAAASPPSPAVYVPSSSPTFDEILIGDPFSDDAMAGTWDDLTSATNAAAPATLTGGASGGSNSQSSGDAAAAPRLAVRCGVNATVPMHSAVTHLLGEMLRRYGDTVPPAEWRRIRDQFIAFLHSCVSGGSPPPPAMGGSSSDVDSHAHQGGGHGGEEAGVLAQLNAAIGPVSTALMDALKRTVELQCDKAVRCGEERVRESAVAALQQRREARVESLHFGLMLSLFEGMSHAKKLVRQLSLAMCMPKMSSHVLVEMVNLRVYEKLRVSAEQQRCLNAVWNSWLRRNLKSSSIITAAASSLNLLPTCEDIPVEWSAYVAARAAQPCGHAAPAGLGSCTWTRKLLGPSDVAVSAAETGIDRLHEALEEAAESFLYVLSQAYVPGWGFNADQGMAFYADQVATGAMYGDVLRVVQCAAQEHRRLRVFAEAHC